MSINGVSTSEKVVNIHEIGGETSRREVTDASSRCEVTDTSTTPTNMREIVDETSKRGREMTDETSKRALEMTDEISRRAVISSKTSANPNDVTNDVIWLVRRGIAHSETAVRAASCGAILAVCFPVSPTVRREFIEALRHLMSAREPVVMVRIRASANMSDLCESNAIFESLSA
eukprot:96766_1